MKDENADKAKSDQAQPPNGPQNGRGQANGGQNEQTSIWEWIVAIIGLVLVVGAIGYTLYQAVAGDKSPPNISLQVTSIVPLDDGYLVKFSAVNRGGATAKGLMVEGELKQGEESVEVSETHIDYLPGHSQREGGLFFSHNPQEYELQLRAKGYEKP